MPCLSSDQKKSNYETVRIQEALRELRRWKRKGFIHTN